MAIYAKGFVIFGVAAVLVLSGWVGTIGFDEDDPSSGGPVERTLEIHQQEPVATAPSTASSSKSGSSNPSRPASASPPTTA